MIDSILIAAPVVDFDILHVVTVSMMESGSTDPALVSQDDQMLFLTTAWALVSLILCVTLALVFEREFPSQH